MSNSQNILEEIIKTASGFLIDAARSYALFFFKSLPKGTEKIEEFNKAFFIGMIQRDTLVEITKKEKQGNLLWPLYDKGIDEVYRAFERIGIDAKYKLDLPTMVLYSMLLESVSLRIVFEKADNLFYQNSFKVIHGVVTRVCPYQVKVDEAEFCKLHITMMKPFLSKHRSVGQNQNEALNSIIDNMFAGNKQLGLGDNSGSK